MEVTEDEDFKRALQDSLDYEFNKVLKLSKNSDLQLFTEDIQLETAIKLSLSTKQPVFQKPIGKIYIIDSIFKDTLLNILIDRGCLKNLYSFCTTRWYYYDIIRRERDNIGDKLLILKQVHPSLINPKINSFEKVNYFEINKIYTKQYYVVANSDKCGCTTKLTILYIKIPIGNKDIIIGRNKENNPITSKCNQSCYFHKNREEKELKPGTNSNGNAKMLLNFCIDDIRCNEILKSYK